jgi:hypothetical protein
MPVLASVCARPHGCTVPKKWKTGTGSMSGLEALQSVQFLTAKGKRFAVLSAEDWESLIEWLETLEDVQVARQAIADLKAAGGDRKQAGWLDWKSVAGELG